jgi:AraC-like DNA-binding protein
LFSEVEGTTIEKYFINQKIEKVKELLMYDELTLSEISYQLNYSSVAYLSNQFKKVTGFTPTYFKHLKDKKRKQIEDL